MPADREQARQTASRYRDAVDGVTLAPNAATMVNLCRDYLALEAELLAAQEDAKKADAAIEDLATRLLAAQEAKNNWHTAYVRERQAAQEREKALLVRDKELHQAIVDLEEREKALREALERIYVDEGLDPALIDELLAGSPSEKPGSEDDWQYTEEKCDFAPIMSRADFERRARGEGWLVGDPIPQPLDSDAD